ncbi:MAG: alpha/beta hydrolase [bacterium]|nr:alpha/beta hydrolase [bacterium]MDY4100133.1 alpha/beta hydrolase [Lachnospiraceae bacterium]
MSQKKIAVVFSGMGYTNDKPLLYYSRKLAAEHGYEVICTGYHDLPEKIRGNKEKMIQAGMLAFEQCREQLKDIDLTVYDEVLFIGKSIGTVMAAKYAFMFAPAARLVLYTPLEATFSFGSMRDAIAFIGEADPWSELSEVKRLAAEHGVPLYTYPGCNHSLECDSQRKNIEILREVMELTEKYIVQNGMSQEQ